MANPYLAAAASASPLSRAGVAGVALLLWDALINLSDEVEYVWWERNTWVKWTYLYMRYLPIMAACSELVLSTSEDSGIHFSPIGCRGWLIYQAVTMLSLIWVVEGVLIVRIYIIYYRSKPVLWCLIVLFALEIGAMIFSVIKTIPRIVMTPGCLVVKSPRIYLICWLSSLVFQTVLVILTATNFFRSIDCRLGGQTILHVVVRDGIWAYGLVVVVELVNTLMFQLNKTALAGVCFTWMFVVLSFAGSHIQMNILKEINFTDEESPSQDIITTHILFAEPERSACQPTQSMALFP